MDLLKQQCVPCNKDTDPLTEDQIQELLSQVAGWDYDSPKLRRVFEFSDYEQALLFTQKIGELAEENGHHPRLITEYGQVTVEWWTHAINGLHQNDFVMAAKTDDVHSRWDLISGKRDVVDEASDESFPASDPPAY